MKRCSRKTTVTVLATMLASLASPAMAQSNNEAMQLLKRLYEPQGYEFLSAQRAGNEIRAIACRNGKRANVTTSLQGKVIRFQEAGACDQAETAKPRQETAPRNNTAQQQNKGFTAQQAEAYLTNQGFEQIELYRENGRLRARACGDNRIHRFTVAKDGAIRSTRTNERCRSSAQSEQVRFAPSKIESMLEREGFDRIAVLQRQKAPYIARACRGRNRVELTIGRRGGIGDQKRVDGCAPAIDPKSLAGFLRQKGYGRVNVVKTDKAPYAADVCQDRNRLRLVVGRYGEIERSTRIGRCAGLISEAGLRELLSRQGLIALSVDKRRRGWSAEVCDGDRRMALRIGTGGRIRGEQVTGNCESATVLDVLETLENRGARRVTAFVEGCWQGRKYRWSFDRLGNRTGRERIGVCR